MLLRFEDGRSFAQGACTFLYHPATEEDVTPRIIVAVQIEGLQTETVVDTGGVYLVCDPEIADLLDVDPARGLGIAELNIRGIKVSGSLHRLSLTLLAEQGQSIELEATAFVPRLQPNEPWKLPSFMGLMGCLERLRFAVDPSTDTFYFGALDGGG